MEPAHPDEGASWFSECEPALDDRPIRQGDVFRFDETHDDAWQRLGVIVTGDCDIARNKHAGRLTYVPILPAHSYLSMFWLPRRLEALGKKLGERLVPMMRRIQQANLPQFTTPLTAERAQNWAVEKGPANVADALLLNDGPDREELLKLAHAYVDVTRAHGRSFREQFGAVCLAYCTLGTTKNGASALKRVEGELENYLANLPGDALFLGCLSQEYVEGYVCYLRVLRDVGDEDIAVTQRQAARGARASRIAHLNSPYLYRLTQQLAEVFASIGLPQEYEDSRSGYAATILQHHAPPINGDLE
jgi:hypothetical protein